MIGVDSTSRKPTPLRRNGVASLPVVVYAGVAVAVGGLWYLAGQSASFPSAIGGFGPLVMATGVVWVLTGAAFHRRQPDAWSRHRALTASLALRAASAVLAPAAAILIGYGWFPAALGSTDMAFWGVGFGIIASTVSVLAGLLLWLGVRRARRAPDVPHARRVVGAIAIIAGLSLINRGPSLGSLFEAANMAIGAIQLQLAVVSTVQVLVSAALSIALVNGALAGERPRAAWRLAAAAELLVLVGRTFYPLVLLLLGDSARGAAIYVLLPQTIGLTGALLMLGAFGLGLPSEGQSPPMVEARPTSAARGTT